MAITLTEKAAKHINRYMERRGKGIGLRFGVRTTGCSGLAYKLEYVDETAAEDNVFESYGVKVFVDPKSLSRLGRQKTNLANSADRFQASNMPIGPTTAPRRRRTSAVLYAWPVCGFARAAKAPGIVLSLTA